MNETTDAGDLLAVTVLEEDLKPTLGELLVAH